MKGRERERARERWIERERGDRDRMSKGVAMHLAGGVCCFWLHERGLSRSSIHLSHCPCFFSFHFSSSLPVLFSFCPCPCPDRGPVLKEKAPPTAILFLSIFAISLSPFHLFSLWAGFHFLSPSRPFFSLDPLSPDYGHVFFYFCLHFPFPIIFFFFFFFYFFFGFFFFSSCFFRGPFSFSSALIFSFPRRTWPDLNQNKREKRRRGKLLSSSAVIVHVGSCICAWTKKRSAWSERSPFPLTLPSPFLNAESLLLIGAFVFIAPNKQRQTT
jgi:hypothetical protein